MWQILNIVYTESHLFLCKTASTDVYIHNPVCVCLCVCVQMGADNLKSLINFPIL